MAVPVLVKDGKPCSSDTGGAGGTGGASAATGANGATGGNMLECHTANNNNGSGENVKSEYLLPSAAASSVAMTDMCTSADLVAVASAAAVPPPPPPLPTLMHMGYGGHHRHQYDAAASLHHNQGNMCTYLPHRSSWQ